MKRQSKSKSMKQEVDCCNSYSWHHKAKNKCGGIYGLGFIGAAIYFISTATGFWAGCLGILKALVWPAFLIFKLLQFLGA